MPRELELSWVAKLKQWRKRRKVNGKTKTFYLGAGTSKSDRLSYVRALAKWREIEETLDLAERGDKLRQQLAAWRDELASRPDVDASVYLIATKSKVDETKPLSASMQRWLDGTARVGEDRFAPTSTASTNGKTMGQAVADYIEAQRERYEHGLRFPNAPQRERISGVRFMSYRYNAQLIKADWEKEPLPKDEAGMASLMERFKERQKALMTAGQIQPGTLNERLKTLRHVVRWLHRKYVIQSLPREIIDICAMYRVPTTAKALDLATIHRLWDGASPRLKTYMALALNCGFYVGDIATLEYSHIKDGYVLKDRHKTNVPTRFKLWSVTKALLDANANGSRNVMLVTEDGGPLLVIDPYAKNGKGKRWCKIETDLLATRKRLGINGVTFSMFRDTSSTKIESIDRTLTDLFDGHKDARMARFYVDGDMVDYDRLFAALDKAIDELERFYQLKLPTSA
jgi:integrase